ncbi:uncharacterized protein N7496_004151 [Penicillium cataractarum]|uniref:Uncharacterized protein n=1 Tax=Penicillium cataractarum TaxID=2100454 RepID=A0A9W9SNF7_9EURO|nr:uncharacterized protein N7496_004151 [Penicillium cataractarum]KAJ5381723.1 hypothetical protein N7496_004151 [Penicillium cataractarum]
MISEALQPKALLAHPQALALQFRTLLATDPSIENFNSINSHILDQVHTEAAHSSVFAIWISLICQDSPHITASALRDPSYGVRNAAIKVVRRKLFRASQWKEGGWDVLGGAKGIKDILDQLPMVQVRLLVKAIFGRCDVFSDRDLVSACVEEFLALVDNTDGWASRSLGPHVSFLSAYCGAERVEHLLRSQWRTYSEFLDHISRFHTPLLRQIGVGVLQMPHIVRHGILNRCRNSLLKSKATYDPVYYRENEFEMSPGLLFGMDLLMMMEKEAVQYNHHDLCSWVESILDQGIREKQPFDSILLILNQGLALLQASASARPKGSSGWLSQSLSQCVIQLWSISRFGQTGSLPKGVVATCKKRYRTKALAAHQESLEQCLIHRVLQNNDESFKVQENSQEVHQAMFNLLSLVSRKGKLEFLQLLCRHSPSLGFDLKAWPPSKEEEEYMPCWELRILNILPPDDSQFLFRRSLHIHHCDEFLLSSGNEGPSSKFPSWEAQCLLWATWESADSTGNGFVVTRKGMLQFIPSQTLIVLLITGSTW